MAANGLFHNASLWASILAAPLAWFMQLLVVYGLTPWVGTSFSAVSLATSNLAWLGIALAAVTLAIRQWLALRDVPEDDEDGCTPLRMKFMSNAALISSVLFSVLILLQVGPMLLLDLRESGSGY